MLPVGLGMTGYGVIYFLFHDVVVHRRVRLRGVPQWPYLRRIVKAHLVHHRTHGRDGAQSFGFLYAPAGLADPRRFRTNAERGPQNTTGRRLHAADHWIYAKSGRPCPLCGTVLDGRSDRQSEWGRVTVWCPACQPLEQRRAFDLDRARRLLALHPARRQAMYPSS